MLQSEEREPISSEVTFDCYVHLGKNIHFQGDSLFELDQSTDRNKYEINGTCITLFGKNCDFWVTLMTESDWLFTMCRRTLMELNSLVVEIPDECEYVKRKISERINRHASVFRSEISVFLGYVLTYMKLCNGSIEKSSMIAEQLPHIELKLKSLYKLFHCLSVSYHNKQFLSYTSVNLKSKFSNSAYYLVHCHLEFRWYFILITEKLKEIKASVSESLLKQTLQTSLNFNEDDIFKSTISELISMSVIKFRENKDENIYVEQVFSCSCVKELWSLLFQHLDFQAFWKYFDEVTRANIEDKFPRDNERLKNTCSLSLKSITDIECFFYLLDNILKLSIHVYDKIIYPPNLTIFTLFNDMVKIFLDSQPSEKLLRSILPLISSVLNMLEHGNGDALISLWEHFYKKLNSEFRVPGSNFIETALENKSGAEMLKEVKERFLPKPNSDIDENSYSLFLRILGLHLRQCRSRNLPMLRLYGRIYVKLYVPNKIVQLSQLGLYRTFSLFLTIVLALDVEVEIKKLYNLFIAIPSEDLSPDKRTIIFKSLAACIILLTEKGFHIKDVAEHMIKEVGVSLLNNDTSDLPIIMECLQILIEKKNSESFILIDEWIEIYLQLAPKSMVDRLMKTFQPLISSFHRDLNWCSKEEAEQIKNRLYEFVLPAAKKYLVPSAAQIAGEFISLFVHGLQHYTDLYGLYYFWINCEDSDLCTKFIISTYKDQRNMLRLKELIPNYHVDIVETLCKIVASTPNIINYARTVGYNWFEEQDSLAGFIHLFGLLLQRSEKLSEISTACDKFNTYFKKLEKWIKLGVEEMEKNSDLISNVYKYSGLIVAECHLMIYKRSNPCNVLKIIVDKLLLPVKIFQKNYTISQSVVGAIITYLPLYIKGLFKLNPKYDFYISRILYELIRYYMPHLNDFVNGNFQVHPLHKCFIDIDNTIRIADVIRSLFLTVSSAGPHPEAANCIRLFISVKLPSARDKIFEICITDVLNLIMLSEDKDPVVACSLSYIRNNINESIDCRESLIKALEVLCAKEIIGSPIAFFRLLLQLKNICARDVVNLLPLINRELAEVKKVMDIDQEPNFRAFEQDLRHLLGWEESK